MWIWVWGIFVVHIFRELFVYLRESNYKCNDSKLFYAIPETLHRDPVITSIAVPQRWSNSGITSPSILQQIHKLIVDKHIINVTQGRPKPNPSSRSHILTLISTKITQIITNYHILHNITIMVWRWRFLSSLHYLW